MRLNSPLPARSRQAGAAIRRRRPFAAGEPRHHGTQTPLPDDPTRLLPVDPHSLGLGISGPLDPLRLGVGARGSMPLQGLPPTLCAVIGHSRNPIVGTFRRLEAHNGLLVVRRRQRGSLLAQPPPDCGAENIARTPLCDCGSNFANLAEFRSRLLIVVPKSRDFYTI